MKDKIPQTWLGPDELCRYIGPREVPGPEACVSRDCMYCMGTSWEGGGGVEFPFVLLRCFYLRIVYLLFYILFLCFYLRFYFPLLTFAFLFVSLSFNNLCLVYLQILPPLTLVVFPFALFIFALYFIFFTHVFIELCFVSILYLDI